MDVRYRSGNLLVKGEWF